MRTRERRRELHADAFLYERLADELGAMVERGALRAGDRLPSVRRLSEERGVSVATVLAAYLRLEDAASSRCARSRGTSCARGAPPIRRCRACRGARRRRRASRSPPAPTISSARCAVRGLVPLGSAYVAAELLPLRKLNAALAAVAREGGGPGGALRRAARQRAAAPPARAARRRVGRAPRGGRLRHDHRRDRGAQPLAARGHASRAT